MIQPSPWSASAVAAIDERASPVAPVIDPRTVAPILPGFDLWDHWPVQTPDGQVAEIAGGALVMLLSAPADPDPDDRHAIARIRLMHQGSWGWRDLGNLFPDDHAPGSREWAGSAVLSDDGVTLSVHFTAAGRRGEQALSFEQRMFETHASLSVAGQQVTLGDWSLPVETAIADGRTYMRDMAGGGALGTIKAFRDPAWFRDPADSCEYLLFTASLAASASPWNGAIGIARDDGEGWTLLPPLIDADGVNNELERPHIVMHDGRYYLFWSTQAKVFADGGPRGPNGLYGMVADALAGPWRPLNGTGLVLANPAEAPFQAYSWLVLADLRVLSFADIVGLDRMPRDTAEARAHFGGTPAPVIRITLDGDRSALVD